MTCELVCVGTELLLGNILNTNAKYLSEKCAEFGLSLFYQTVIGDNPERLRETALQAINRSDVIIFTGGLGPTSDDITKEIVCAALELELIEDKTARENLVQRVSSLNCQLTKNNYKQAMVPVGATVLYNHNGTAPGLLIEKEGKKVILLPGPPKELIPMFEEYLTPYFSRQGSDTIYSIMVKLSGIGESEAAFRIKDLIEKSDNPTVAPYAKTNQVHLRITAKSKTEEDCKTLIEPVYKQIEEELGDYIFTTKEEEDLEDVVVRKLLKNGLKISCAESCTGGLLAARLINVAGVSEALKESFVTYCDEAKIKRLGVQPEILEKYSAVSKECAMQMAEGVAKVTGSDIGVATTGYAGPDGENVGLVFVAAYYNGMTTVEKMNLPFSRNDIREAAVSRALTLVNKLL